MKATATTPSNIAFTKYWGKKDEILRLPENGSISMCLSNLLTTTTVEFSDTYKKDEVILNSVHLAGDEVVASSPPRWPNGLLAGGDSDRVIRHLDRIRKLVGINQKARVVSNNNFPSGTGLSSSASGFAALTVAAAHAAGLKLSEKELSILARQGSGSACRSIPSGFVEWLDGNTSETSYAESIFPANYWDITDVVAVVSNQKKDVPTSVGQQTSGTSPFMENRLSRMRQKNETIKALIKKRDFVKFGKLIEAEALELHAIMLTQKPALIYWLPTTVLLMKLVQKWRSEGLEVYFTINTGQDVHLICQKKDVDTLVKLVQGVEEVKDVIINSPGEGARTIESHLF